MTSNALALVTDPQIPIATQYSIYDIHEVESKYAKVPQGGEHDGLRKLYDEMLRKGSLRYQVKPSKLPDIEKLYGTLPNFHDVLDDVRRATALALSGSDALEITLTLLLGPPGVGKTHFAKQVADLLGTGSGIVPMSSNTAGWLLSGSSSQWKGSKPGKVFDILVNGYYANPVIVVDEVDKGAQNAQYDPLGALYSLLEHDTARGFTDEYAEVSLDASKAIWILTANDERSIPRPILNRMNVYEIQPPTIEEARRIAEILYSEIRGSHDWGKMFDSDLQDDVLDYVATLGPRELRRAFLTAFGNAKLDKRSTITVADFPKKGNTKQSIGFLN